MRCRSLNWRSNFATVRDILNCWAFYLDTKIPDVWTPSRKQESVAALSCSAWNLGARRRDLCSGAVASSLCTQPVFERFTELAGHHFINRRKDFSLFRKPPNFKMTKKVYWIFQTNTPEITLQQTGEPKLPAAMLVSGSGFVPKGESWHVLTSYRLFAIQGRSDICFYYCFL